MAGLLIVRWRLSMMTMKLRSRMLKCWMKSTR